MAKYKPKRYNLKIYADEELYNNLVDEGNGFIKAMQEHRELKAVLFRDGRAILIASTDSVDVLINLLQIIKKISIEKIIPENVEELWEA